MGYYRRMSIFETILYHRVIGTFNKKSIQNGSSVMTPKSAAVGSASRMGEMSERDSGSSLLNKDWSRKGG